MALPTRLTRTCRSRPGSPTSAVGTSGAMSHSQLEPLLVRAHGERLQRCRRRTSRKRERHRAPSSSLPASIFEKSRMSLMMPSSDSADVLDRLAGTRAGRRSARVSSASSVMPMMPFIGVRISWLMLARNSLLARLASSARFFDSSRSVLRARSSAVRFATCSSSCS